MKAVFVQLALVLCAVTPALAVPSQGVSASGEGVHRFQLHNGLSGVLVEDHANPFVALTAVVGAGSIDEPKGTAGASHFLEHLLFNGTESMNQRELYEAVDRIGAYNNASTRPDHTVFLMLAPSRHVAEAMRIQSEMLFRSTLPPDKFEKERGIVAEEIRKDRDRESYRLGLAIDKEIHGGTPLEAPVLGTVEDIEGLERETVMAYYRRQYVPANVTLLVVGDITPRQLDKRLRQTYGRVPKADRPERTFFHLDLPRGETLTTLPADSKQTHMMAVLPGPPAGSAEAVALTVLVDLWNRGTFTGGGKPTLSAGLQFLRGGSYLEFGGILPRGESPAAAMEELREQLRQAAQVRPGREAVDRAVRQARVAEAGYLERPHYYGLMRADQISAAGIDAALGRIRALQSISPSDLERAATKWLGSGQVRAVAAGPGLEGRTLTLAPLVVPEGGGGPSRSTSPSTEVVTVREVLENGLVVLVETAPASHLAAIHLLARHRSAREPEGKEGIADLTHRLLPRGTRNRSADQIQEALDTMGATLKVTDATFIPYDDYYFNPEFSYMRMEVLAEDADSALQLLADLALSPAFQEDEIEMMRTEMQDLLRRKSAEARYMARDAFRKALFHGHPLSSAPYGTQDSLASITRKDLLSFHASYFAPDNLVLSVVSPLPADRVLATVRQLFGPARPAGNLTEPPDLGPSEAEEPERVVAEVGNEQTILYMGRILLVAEEDWPALLAANAVLSERLAFHLRERKGLAYVVGSSVQRTPYGAYLAVTLGTAPENVQTAEKLARSEMSHLASRLDRRELEQAVGRLTGRALMRRLPSISRAYYLGLGELEGSEPGDDLDLLDRIAQVSPREVRDAARTYLKPEGLVVVEAR